MKLSDLAESRIRKAQAEGQFDNLSGAGKPLDRGQDSGSMEAVGFRIMAEAGALPREIELRRAIEAQRLRLQGALGGPAEKAEMAALAALEMRLNIEVEARRKFLGG